jgi:hypothetical protein
MPFITVRFIANHTFLSWSIRRLTGSLFSHVELGTPEGTWIGALADGIKERPANYCNPFREYVYHIPCTQSALTHLLSTARMRIGTPYNKMDIVGLALGLRRLVGKKGEICSWFGTQELIDAFGADRVLNVLPGWEYRITPETLHLSPIFVGNLFSRKG